MSITAFPVLARILTESKLILSTAGVMTMGAAALNDAIAWCLLGACVRRLSVCIMFGHCDWCSSVLAGWLAD